MWTDDRSSAVPEAATAGPRPGRRRPSHPPASSVRVPVQTDDAWETASVAEVGLAEQPLVDALNEIRRGTYKEIHALVVVQDGKLVLEDYGRGRMYDGSRTTCSRRR